MRYIMIGDVNGWVGGFLCVELSRMLLDFGFVFLLVMLLKCSRGSMRLRVCCFGWTDGTEDDRRPLRRCWIYFRRMQLGTSALHMLPLSGTATVACSSPVRCYA